MDDDDDDNRLTRFKGRGEAAAPLAAPLACDCDVDLSSDRGGVPLLRPPSKDRLERCFGELPCPFGEEDVEPRGGVDMVRHVCWKFVKSQTLVTLSLKGKPLLIQSLPRQLRHLTNKADHYDGRQIK